MHKFYCPVCGTEHTTDKGLPYKLRTDCRGCKTPLNVDATKKALSVRFREPKGET
jgi:uncharacterized Zn finger protein (UPF0148 family)